MAVPGQRAVQHPMRAAAASQRVLGRAATQNVGEAVPPRGVALLGGVYYIVDLTGGAPRLVPRPPVPSVPVPVTPPARVVAEVPGGGVVDVVASPPKPKTRPPRRRRARPDGG